MIDVQTLSADGVAASPSLWLLAELTHRYPLHCAFCYNPVDFARRRDELSTAQWINVPRQTYQLGVVQLGFSGGEPLLRNDLEELIAEEWQPSSYANLIILSIGLTKARLACLKAAELDHVQLSFQGSTHEMSDLLSSTCTLDLELRIVLSIKQYDYLIVLNVVLRRHNLDHAKRTIGMAVVMGVKYLELTNTQYYGWGLINQTQLMSAQEQLQRAKAVVNAYRGKLGSRLRILFMMPGYFGSRLKTCMSGWGAVFLTVMPDGIALPYHATQTVPDLHFSDVADIPLVGIRNQSGAFNHLRGDTWTQEPCRSCPGKHKGFGGRRCRASAFAGDVAQADPVYNKSPHHNRIQEIVLHIRRTQQSAVTGKHPLVFRSDASSLCLSSVPKRSPGAGRIQTSFVKRAQPHRTKRSYFSSLPAAASRAHGDGRNGRVLPQSL